MIANFISLRRPFRTGSFLNTQNTYNIKTEHYSCSNDQARGHLQNILSRSMTILVLYKHLNGVRGDLLQEVMISTKIGAAFKCIG